MAMVDMLVGLPGSGKSYYAQEEYKVLKELNIDVVIHSSDAIREELTGDVNNQEINSKVFEILHKRIKEDLLADKVVIYDATNISRKRRKAFVESLSKINCTKICTVIATPLEACIAQNSTRDREVPSDVICRMYKQFDIPWYNEGWDSIGIHYPKQTYNTIYGKAIDFIEIYKDFDQKNPCHSLTLGNHCYETSQNLKKYFKKVKDIPLQIRTHKYDLEVAALLHDCGKPGVQTFTNTKSGVGEFAHYHNHEHTGSYDSLFYDKGENIDNLFVAAIIRWHMLFHFSNNWKTKTQDKYFKEFNTDKLDTVIHFWDMLKIFYYCDKIAH